METKVCIKCKLTKELTKFGNSKTTKDKHTVYCKECNNSTAKESRIKNPEYSKEWRKKNPTKSKEYYDKNPKKVNEINKKWRRNNPEKMKASSQNYYENNKEKINEKHNEWLENNPGYYSKLLKDRRKSDPLFKLTTNVRNLIRNSITNGGYKKNSRTYKILGCSFEEFMKYIESKFEDWMTWGNYGKHKGKMFEFWSYDHIIPTSSAITEEDIIKLNHYTNFQPLCSYINEVIKSDRLDFYE